MRRIKLQTVINEIEGACDVYTGFYDLCTGETVALFDSDFADDKEENEALEELIDSQPDRFLRFPTQYEIHEYRIMEAFMLSLEQGVAQQRLARAMKGKGAFRRFKDTLIDLDIENNWFAYKAEAYREMAIRWCKDNDLEIEE